MIVPETVYIVAFGGDGEQGFEPDQFTDFKSFHIEGDALKYFSIVFSNDIGRVALFHFDYIDGLTCWNCERMAMSTASQSVSQPKNAAHFCYSITKAYACLMASMYVPVSLADQSSAER